MEVLAGPAACGQCKNNTKRQHKQQLWELVPMGDIERQEASTAVNRALQHVIEQHYLCRPEDKQALPRKLFGESRRSLQ